VRDASNPAVAKDRVARRVRPVSSRAARWAGIALLTVVVVLGLAQAILPRVARDQVRDRLAKHGTVEHVEVHAFPAIKLLWKSADRVDVAMASYRANSTADFADLLASLHSVGRADATIGAFALGPVRLTDASVRKRGDEVVGNATLGPSPVQAGPAGAFTIRPVGARGGELVLRGTAGQLIAADLTLGAENGGLVVSPDVPFGGLVKLTVFSDPRVQVESIAARPQGSGYRVVTRARVR
jgi:hypothetical protein